MPWTRTLTSGQLPDQADCDQRSIDSQMRELVVDGGRPLQVFEAGQGEPILLMPMMAELNFVYAPQIEEFASDHRVILYQPRLSARSYVGIANRADEALSLMTGLGLDGAHLIVWGDTGAAAYYLAKQHPEQCKSIVFIGLADRYKLAQPYQSLLHLLRLAPLEGIVPPRLFAWILGGFVGGTHVKPEWFVQRASRVPDVAGTFKHSILPNLVEHRPVAGELRVPCLVIGGDNDRVVSAAQAKRMAALLPDAQLAIVEGGEHFVSYVDGPTVNRLIRRFYASIASTPAARVM